MIPNRLSWPIENLGPMEVTRGLPFKSIGLKYSSFLIPQWEDRTLCKSMSHVVVGRGFVAFWYPEPNSTPLSGIIRGRLTPVSFDRETTH